MAKVIDKLNKYLLKYNELNDIYEFLTKDDYYLEQGWSKSEVLDVHDILVRWLKEKPLFKEMREKILKLVNKLKKHKTEDNLNALTIEINKFGNMVMEFNMLYRYL